MTENDLPPHMPEGMSRQTIARMPVAIVITDPHEDDNPIIYVNDAFVATTGYAREACVGRNCRFLQGPDTDPEDVRRIREAVEAEEEIDLELINHKADGSRFCNRLLVTPLRWEDGSLAYFLGVQADCGADETARDRAHELTERLAELQHRVKNHLAMVVALIRMEAGKEQNPDTTELLARRVQALSLLYEQFSKSSSDTESIPLGAYLSRVCSATQQIAAPDLVRLNIDMAQVEADMDQAARVGLFLSEVLNNALQHGFESGERGEIRIMLDRNGNEVVLTVSDNGMGLGTSDWPDEGSLGGRIITNLVDRIGGKLEVASSDRGVTIQLTMDHQRLSGADG